ncbi:hypothetical protein GCM10027093_72850 [Paraburkholderia jirisanensis]
MDAHADFARPGLTRIGQFDALQLIQPGRLAQGDRFHRNGSSIMWKSAANVRGDAANERFSEHTSFAARRYPARMEK